MTVTGRRLVVIVGINQTGLRIIDGEITSRLGSIDTPTDLEAWVATTAAEARKLWEEQPPQEICVVVPGSITTDGRIVSLGRYFATWTGKDIAQELSKALGGIRTTACEAAMALALSERRINGRPIIAVDWGVGITAAYVNGRGRWTIPAGHVATTPHSGLPTCPCGAEWCNEILLGATTIREKYGDEPQGPDNPSFGSTSIMQFTGWVLTGLIHDHPGRAIVLGGSVLGNPFHPENVISTIEGWLPRLISTQLIPAPPNIGLATSMYPMTDGALEWMTGR